MCLGFKLPLLELSLTQVGYSPLEGFITPLVLSRLFSLHSSPSTSLPYCAPNSFGESLFYVCYDMFLIICSADPLEKSPEIQVLSTSCGSPSDAKIGRHWEGKVLAKLGRGDTDK